MPPERPATRIKGVKIVVQENIVQFKQKRNWQHWRPQPGMRVIGGQVVFETEHPEIAEIAKSISEIHPEAHDRLREAAFLVAGGQVELLHLNHFRVESSYIVYGLADGHAICMCDDWHRGNVSHRYKADCFGRKVGGGAPLIPGLGLACAHVLACYIAELITPHVACSCCDGRSYKGWEIVDGYMGKTAQAKPCPACNGTGAALAELPHTDPDYYEEKVQDDGCLDFVPTSEDAEFLDELKRLEER